MYESKPCRDIACHAQANCIWQLLLVDVQQFTQVTTLTKFKNQTKCPILRCISDVFLLVSIRSTAALEPKEKIDIFEPLDWDCLQSGIWQPLQKVLQHWGADLAKVLERPPPI